MNITLRQINIFVEVAKHLNITKAAQSLFLTQPAVSMQIKQLESQVACDESGWQDLLDDRQGKEHDRTRRHLDRRQHGERQQRFGAPINHG